MDGPVGMLMITSKTVNQSHGSRAAIAAKRDAPHVCATSELLDLVHKIT